MKFELIDMENWPRKEYFDQYFKNVPCTYSMVVKLDITNVRKKGLRMYPAMMYYLTTVINRHVEFRMDIDKEGNVGYYDKSLPRYTVFHKDTETFSTLWTEFDENLEKFTDAYIKDLAEFGDNHRLEGKPHTPRNYFSVSMVPWTTFEGLNINIQNGYDYLKPVFTLGKFYEENGKILMPIAIQVHHAVCDGFHTTRFLKELQELINE